MSCNKCCSEKHMPEIGRGFSVCDCNGTPEVETVEGCFKLHETPWLESYPDNVPTDIFEVRFKNTRRSYYRNVNDLPLKRGDIVAVEASPGHDIGIVSLTGDMVAKQIRRTGFTPFNGEYKKIYRKAKPYDIERWQEAIALEHDTMIQSRQIAAEMGLDMKIGDVEYQGDGNKAIFYYIADERVDFRQLIKVLAEVFRVRIEMRQIGARQEAGRIGGIGPCGRPLCCSSWMNNFVSVATSAARYQDISLNPQKLAGQCAKLKCCLNFEVDTYVESVKRMPPKEVRLETTSGTFYHFKTDIFKREITYSSDKQIAANLVTISAERAFEVIAMNKQGEKPDSLMADGSDNPRNRHNVHDILGDGDVTRFDKKKKKKGKGQGAQHPKPKGEDSQPRKPKDEDQAKTAAKPEGQQPPKPKSKKPKPRQQQPKRPPQTPGE